MKPFFTSNDSDINQLEGLYIKERNPPAVISGANLSKVCIVGETIRGPVNRAVDVGSEGRLVEVFGGRDQGSGGAITNKVWLAMLNKPFGTVTVVRTAAAGAGLGTHTFSDVTPTAIIRVDASSVGLWSTGVTVDIVVPSSDGVSGRFDLVAHYLGKAYTYANLDVSATGVDNTLQVIGDDESNVVVVTKLANGTPLAATGTALTGGTEGSIADSDYTATALGVAAAAEKCGVVMATRQTTAVKAALFTLSATVNDRLFLMSAAAETTSESSAITDAASYRSDRVVYCFNHPYTQDPTTATNVLTNPCEWMASILSQTDVDIHPGEEDSKQFTQGISKLYHEEYLRADYKAFKAAGIACLEKDGGFAFVSGVTTSLTSGKTEITRRRSADFLQLSVASELKYSPKKKNTTTRRKSNAGIVTAFLGDLQGAERVVERYSVDTETLNTPTQRALGIEKMLMRVKLIGHILELVLETEIGTSVVITQQ